MTPSSIFKFVVLSGCFLVFPTEADQVSKQANMAAFYATIEANNRVSQSLALSVGAKMLYLSATLLDAPYVDGSLGEGEQGDYDKDPLVRFDVFDCTTYVETVLAGAMSAAVEDFLPNLMRLRYKEGKVSFVTRNHFPSLDWLPNNQGILTDQTEMVAKGEMRMAQTVIDKAAWYQKMSKDRLTCDHDASSVCEALLEQLHNEGHAFRPQRATLPYVPLKAVYLEVKEGKWRGINQALLDRIPSGSIISMVRPDWQLKKWIGTNMNVSHQAIAIRKHGRLYLRHASLNHKKVMDEDFVEYFSHYLGASSLQGFNVQVLNP